MKLGVLGRALPAMMSALAVLADDDVGDAWADRLLEMIGADGITNGAFSFGHGEAEADNLAEDPIPEKQPVDHAQSAITLNDLKAMYRSARAYW